MTTSNSTIKPEHYYKFIDKEQMTREWVLIQSAIPMCSVVVAYLVVVLYAGPRFMASRRPYDLKNLMRVYNLFQVLYNLYFLFVFVTTSGAFTYTLNNICHHGDPDKYPELRKTFLLFSWHYYVLKILDLVDTLFMVLRKRYSHITFLHVYHHAVMVFLTWYSNKYIKAHQGTLPVLINVLVHAVMYTYYFLATLGPSVRRHLWWKKYLTIMQLSQFVVIIIYLWTLNRQVCYVAKDFNIIWIINMAVFIVFFTNFYIHAYIMKPKDLNYNKTS